MTWWKEMWDIELGSVVPCNVSSVWDHSRGAGPRGRIFCFSGCGEGVDTVCWVERWGAAITLSAGLVFKCRRTPHEYYMYSWCPMTPCEYYMYSSCPMTPHEYYMYSSCSMTPHAYYMYSSCSMSPVWSWHIAHWSFISHLHVVFTTAISVIIVRAHVTDHGS